ncbi:MAG: hypothetical protein EBR82_86405, partial [Caulobacteraceae bacterium]|nr:hypothetical protein [Caulobacteraceae bacterium]
MAQLTIPVGARKLFVGQETTYGTAATTAFARHIEGTLNATLSQTEIEHNAGSARLFQQFVTRQGLKSNDSSVAFGIHAKPAFAKLDTSASPSTPYLGKLLEAILGGEAKAAGSTVSGAGSSTTTVDVQSGHGTRFKVGTAIHVEVSSVYYPRVITAIATDTLTVWPELPSAPANGDDVINSYSYFLTESNTKSLTIEDTFTVPSSDAATVQRRLLGCTGGINFSIARDALATFGFDLKAASWDYGSLSLATTVGSETMGDPIPVTNGKIWLQEAGVSTDNQFFVASMQGTLNPGMQHLLTLGGVQGTSGVARMGGRDSAEFTVRARIDYDRYTQWSSQTLLRFFAAFPYG